MLLGGVGYLVYLVISGKAKDFFCPGGGGLCNLWPTQTTLNTPVPPVGTGVSHTQVPSIPSDVLVVMTSSGPQTWSREATVPGTGQTINELSAIGYSDSMIASMITDYLNNPDAYTVPGDAPAGGAGGSW